MIPAVFNLFLFVTLRHYTLKDIANKINITKKQEQEQEKNIIIIIIIIVNAQ